MTLFLFSLAALACGHLLWTVSQSRVLAQGPSGAARPDNAPSPWVRHGVLPLVLAAGLGGAFQSLWPGLALLVFMPLWPRLRARQIESRLRHDLTEQMPALLEALAGGLRAGQSLPQALDSAVEDLPEPSAALARRLGAGLRLGGLPEDLLLDEARAHGGHALAADWRLLATAVAIQRASGGDLAAVLDQLCRTLRERQRLRAQVDALTAQGRLSAWVVGLLPLVLLLTLHWMDPELVAPLFSTPTGWVLLGLGALFEAAGVMLLRRIVDIEA